MPRRSQLYVPGNNERMIVKASTLGADSVVLDLEDAVPPGEKNRARTVIRRMSKELDWGKKELCVRINAIGTPEHAKDVASMRKIGRLDSVLVPKAEGDCTAVWRKTSKSLIPIVETARGLMTVNEIARSRGVVAITYGAGDYAASVGGTVEAYLGNEAVKTLIVAAAKAYGVEAIDNVFFELGNLNGFRAEAMASRALGFTGKQVVHPSQIPIANEVYSPSGDEVEWANRVIAEFEAAAPKKKGAIRVDGKLVDAVHYRLARDILDRRA
jgi:citrate lyase subunit beta / citryl-CoA lyase